MAHHAYLVTGDLEEGIARARLGAEGAEVSVLRFGALTVDDARGIIDLAHSAARGGRRIIVAARRIFGQAQNALLKITEEPPAHTTLVLVLESGGEVLPTLRSRLLPLPTIPNVRQRGTTDTIYGISLAKEFIEGTSAAREKIVAKVLERAKSDKSEEKQSARADALTLAQGLSRIAYDADADRAFLSDLDRFIPILHERAAPLKPILEHILITVPKWRTIDK